MSRITRRRFMQGTAAAGAAAAVSFNPWQRVRGANERIRMGICGINGRGQSHMGAFCKMSGVDVAYLCDPDSRLFKSRQDKAERSSKPKVKPECVQDYRRVLDDKNIDAISIATCNHWHAPLTIHACMAGKDVYVEKPASHNVFEGRIAVRAARKYGRIVQHGTQSRSSGGWWNTIAAVKSGKYGKLLVSHGYCCKPRGSIGIKNPEKAPPPLDFNMWVGPAPMQDFHRNLVHYNWHWFWDFGNGDIGNQGVHQMDIALWALEDENGVSGWPKSVISLGGRFGYKDQGQTPNSQLNIFDYGETKVVFSVRGLKHPRKVDNEFYLEEGAIKRGKFYPKGSDKGEGLPKMNTEKNPGGHFDNFIYAVRSRKNTDLNADILKGHYSAGLCHLGNISYRLGADVPFNKKTKALGDDKYAHDTFAELSEYLSGANKVNLQETNYRLGKKLAFDGKSEKFLNDNQANTLLTREYRKGFEIPSNIA